MDVIPEEQPTPGWVALDELGLLLRTASGRVHPLAAYLGWLHDAGFEPPERHRLVGQVQAARRPQARRRIMFAATPSGRRPADLQLSTYLRPRRSVVSCDDTG